MSIWREIRNSYTDDNGVTHIDAWTTDDDMEEGKVIAYIVNGDIYYKDDRAMDDEYAQEIIKETQKVLVPTCEKLVTQIENKVSEVYPDGITIAELELDSSPLVDSGSEYIEVVSGIYTDGVIVEVCNNKGVEMGEKEMSYSELPEHTLEHLANILDIDYKTYRQKIIDSVLKQIMIDYSKGDVTAIELLLTKVETNELESFLPE